jgi:hypothetical protein
MPRKFAPRRRVAKAPAGTDFRPYGGRTILSTVDVRASSRFLIVAGAALLGFAPSACAQAAAVPFVETFDGAWPSPAWTLAASGFGPGRVLVVAPSTSFPASPQGGGHLVFDAGIPGLYVVNDLTLTVDLAAASGGVLKYFARETDDEPDAGVDGCFLRESAAATWIQIVDHLPLSGTWTEIVVDLGAAAAAHGRPLTATFEIRFSQRDNLQAPNDGLLIDHVRVDLPPPPDLGQWNRPTARFLVPAAANLAGQPPYDGLRGPFFVAAPAGAAFPFAVSGAANQKWILVAGGLHRNALVLPDVGSIDLGVAAGDLLTGFVVVLDGTAPGLLNLLADTGPTGVSSLVLAVPSFPPGFAFALQAAVFDGSSLFTTAATEVLVQ